MISLHKIHNVSCQLRMEVTYGKRVRMIFFCQNYMFASRVKTHVHDYIHTHMQLERGELENGEAAVEGGGPTSHA